MAFEACSIQVGTRLVVLRKRRERTFSPAIDQRFEGFLIFWINKVDQSRVDPSASFDRAQATNDEVELHVVFVVFVFNLAVITVRVFHLKRSFRALVRGPHGVTVTPGTRSIMNLAAVTALLEPTSFCL